MTCVGYEFPRQRLRLVASAPEAPALLKPVTQILRSPGFLAIPRGRSRPTLRILWSIRCSR